MQDAHAQLFGRGGLQVVPVFDADHVFPVRQADLDVLRDVSFPVVHMVHGLFLPVGGRQRTEITGGQPPCLFPVHIPHQIEGEVGSILKAFPENLHHTAVIHRRIVGGIFLPKAGRLDAPHGGQGIPDGIIDRGTAVALRQTAEGKETFEADAVETRTLHGQVKS